MTLQFWQFSKHVANAIILKNLNYIPTGNGLSHLLDKCASANKYTMTSNIMTKDCLKSISKSNNVSVKGNQLWDGKITRAITASVFASTTYCADVYIFINRLE